MLNGKNISHLYLFPFFKGILKDNIQKILTIKPPRFDAKIIVYAESQVCFFRVFEVTTSCWLSKQYKVAVEEQKTYNLLQSS